MFAKVIVDISNSNVDRLFSYYIPDEMSIVPGQRVLVPFGRGNKQIEGFVIETGEECEVPYQIKPITRALEPYTALLPDQLRLAEWICRAYHCTRADSLRGMIPAKLRGSRIREKTVRTLHISSALDRTEARLSLLKKDGTPRSVKQLEVFDLLDSPEAEYSSSDISAFIPGAAPAIAALVKKGILIEANREQLRDPFWGRQAEPTEPLPSSPSKNGRLIRSYPRDREKSFSCTA